MRIAALIVAAGRGTRAGGEIAKQWQALAGRRVADWTVQIFEAHKAVDRIVIVHAAEDLAEIAPFTKRGHLCVPGGATRDASVP